MMLMCTEGSVDPLPGAWEGPAVGPSWLLSLEVLGSGMSADRYAAIQRLGAGDVRVDVSEESDSSDVIMVSRPISVLAA